MILKKIHLVNFCGYEDSVFEFEKPVALFFGPNGIGKSTLLEAIRITSNPKVFEDRRLGAETYLRPLIRDTNFVPIADAVLEKEKEKMLVEAHYLDYEGHEYLVSFDDKGFIRNDLPRRHGSYVYYVDADNPMNWNKFQLIDVHAQRFVEIAEEIYGYKVDLDSEVKDSLTGPDGTTVENVFYQDLVLFKGSDKIHFSRLSAGEKKIATMVRMLCNPDNTDDRGIIMIDNFEMHVYFKRHARMLAKLSEYFGDKQIIATTHSKSMIDHGAQSSYVQNFDLEDFKPEYKLLEKVGE
jgi:predicted ATPase